MNQEGNQEDSDTSKLILLLVVVVTQLQSESRHKPVHPEHSHPSVREDLPPIATDSQESM